MSLQYIQIYCKSVYRFRRYRVTLTHSCTLLFQQGRGLRRSKGKVAAPSHRKREREIVVQWLHTDISVTFCLPRLRRVWTSLCSRLNLPQLGSDGHVVSAVTIFSFKLLLNNTAPPRETHPHSRPSDLEHPASRQPF